MSRCVACDVVLSHSEMCKINKDTGTYETMCKRCRYESFDTGIIYGEDGSVDQYFNEHTLPRRLGGLNSSDEILQSILNNGAIHKDK